MFGYILWFTLVSVCVAGLDRELYLNGPNAARINVSTSYKGIPFVYGTVYGSYEGMNGLFISTFRPPAVYFMNTQNQCEETFTCTLVKLVGTSVAGIDDGNFYGFGGSQASISDPSRMAYSAELNVVFVMDRSSGIIRILHLNSHTVTSVRTNGLLVQVHGSQLPDNNPELDIKINGQYLYVSDSSWVYNITGADGTLAGILTNAIMTPYSALKQWQLMHNYDKSLNKIYLTSIAINAGIQMIYASYTYKREAIIMFPIELVDSSQVQILTTDGILWNPALSVPLIEPEGNLLSVLPSGYSFVGFPMHMQYDAGTNSLYFTEVFAHFSQGTVLGALGSVAIRRINLDSLNIDYFAGAIQTPRFVYGTPTGYLDGWADQARFSYPVTLEFVGSSASPNGGVKMYVVDSQNGAIRLIQSIPDTPRPSSQPTISFAPSRPSHAPTLAAPTLHPTAEPSTGVPTIGPTFQPSISFSPTVFIPPTNQPTELNGECLQFELIDTFGDGWSGSQLRIETPGHAETVIYREPLTPNPEVFQICSSYSRTEQYGQYPMGIISPNNAENLWEILWRVTILAKGLVYTGNSETAMVFAFDENGFVFVDGSSLQSNSFSCTRCQHPKPKPKPGSSSGSSSTHNTENPDECPDDECLKRFLLPGALPPPPNPKPPIITNDLSFVLHDNAGNGWFDTFGDGSNYYISDVNRQHILSQGTLCGEDLFRDECITSLPDGDFYFRVTGTTNPDRDDVFWNFCHTRGTARQELSFTMIDGVCYPGALRDAIVIFSSPTSTKLSMISEILVENVYANELNSLDKMVLEQSMISLLEMSNIVVADAMISSICKSKTGKFCADEPEPDHRRLVAPLGKPAASSIAPGTTTWDISFQISIITEANGIDGTKYLQVVDFVEKLTGIITDGVIKGDLQTIIEAKANSMGSTSLKWSHIHREIPASLMHIHYISTPTPTSAPVSSSSFADSLSHGYLEQSFVTVVVDNSNIQLLTFFLIIGIPLIVVSIYWAYRSRTHGNVEVVPPKNSWENTFFKDTIVSGIVNNNNDNDINSDDLPHPDGMSVSSRHSSKSSSSHVDSLLQIPGRTTRSVSESTTGSDSGNDRKQGGGENPESVVSRIPINSSRLSAGNRRDRFRVREGLEHYDLSKPSIRSGLLEENI
jgi:hypothetical protein